MRVCYVIWVCSKYRRMCASGREVAVSAPAQEKPPPHGDRDGSMAATSSWKSKEQSLLGLWRKCSPAEPGFSPVKLTLGSWPAELWEDKFLVFAPSRFMVICYSSQRNECAFTTPKLASSSEKIQFMSHGSFYWRFVLFCFMSMLSTS